MPSPIDRLDEPADPSRVKRDAELLHIELTTLTEGFDRNEMTATGLKMFYESAYQARTLTVLKRLLNYARPDCGLQLERSADGFSTCPTADFELCAGKVDAATIRESIAAILSALRDLLDRIPAAPLPPTQQ